MGRYVSPNLPAQKFSAKSAIVESMPAVAAKIQVLPRVEETGRVDQDHPSMENNFSNTGLLPLCGKLTMEKKCGDE